MVIALTSMNVARELMIAMSLISATTQMEALPVSVHLAIRRMDSVGILMSVLKEITLAIKPARIPQGATSVHAMMALIWEVMVTALT